VAFFSYATFLIVSGGVLGLLVPRWGPLDFEVYARAIFRLDVSSEVMASTLNQYRFMKSAEFGFGLFAVLFRREIFTIPRFNYFFLGILFLGAFERGLSMLVDGRPHGAYIGFAIAETVIGLVILLHSRRTLARAGEGSSR
jgi:uncharacterized protein DUF4345